MKLIHIYLYYIYVYIFLFIEYIINEIFKFLNF